MRLAVRTFAGALAALTLGPAAPGAAQSAQPPRLFADSRLITGDRISVEVVGSGPDVILIPGLASSRETWRATAERLKGRYRLHMVQVDGFAGEPARANSTGPVLIPTAEAIDRYIKDQGLAPAVAVGHSLGGTIILWLAEHHPRDLRKAMVVDALPFVAAVMLGPDATPDSVQPIAEAIRLAPPQSEAVLEKMIGGMVSGGSDRTTVTGWSHLSDPVVVQNALADDLELDLRPGLASIRTPIVLLYPDDAPLGAPPGATDALYKTAFAAAPTVRLVRIDNSLHFIMFDQPAAFSAQLEAFLAGQ